MTSRYVTLLLSGSKVKRSLTLNLMRVPMRRAGVDGLGPEPQVADRLGARSRTAGNETGHGCVMASPVYSGVAVNRRRPSAVAIKCSLLDNQHLAHRVDPVARPAQSGRGDGAGGLGGVGNRPVCLSVEVVDDGDREVLRGEQVLGDAGDE
jgi:hypothetical protein